MDVPIDDIVMMVNIIDICTKRGAFEGKELYLIGSLRERLAQRAVAEQRSEQED